MRQSQLYRKKPVTIEAAWFKIPEVAESIAAWCGGRVCSESKASDPTDVTYWIDIPTLEGVMKASLGDYIIKGVRGEFYPCKPDIFEDTYERVGIRGEQLITDLDLAAIRNLVDRCVPLNLYTERALLAEIDRLNATIDRVREIVNDKYLDAGQMDVMLHRALELMKEEN